MVTTRKINEKCFQIFDIDGTFDVKIFSVSVDISQNQLTRFSKSDNGFSEEGRTVIDGVKTFSMLRERGAKGSRAKSAESGGQAAAVCKASQLPCHPLGLISFTYGNICSLHVLVKTYENRCCDVKHMFIFVVRFG